DEVDPRPQVAPAEATVRAQAGPATVGRPAVRGDPQRAEVLAHGADLRRADEPQFDPLRVGPRRGDLQSIRTGVGRPHPRARSTNESPLPELHSGVAAEEV